MSEVEDILCRVSGCVAQGMEGVAFIGYSRGLQSYMVSEVGDVLCDSSCELIGPE